MEKELLNNQDIDRFARAIAIELANRNLFAFDFHIFISEEPKTTLGKDCSNLYLIVKKLLTEGDCFSDLSRLDPKPQWISLALEFGKNNGKYDLNKVAVHLCVGLVQQRVPSLDDHVKNLSNHSLCEQLGININDDFLTDLSDKRLQIMNHGIIFDKTTLIYPHQFLRRYYSSNFVGMPSLLNKALQAGASVHLRIDPLRKTRSEYYRNILELDYWYGPRFSRNLLKDQHRSERTLHFSRGIHCSNYDARFTIFRTKMMGRGVREFMIEEYCPLELPGFSGSKSPGVGDNFYIQKFAHICYDQKHECFVHLDGAVRVFDKKQYSSYFKEIEEGRDIDEKAGIRHKIFLVEGKFEEDLAQEILTEWFRYNPHIQEYFSGENVEPLITYEKLKEILIEQ
jgi:hypothetical protein